jgi:hypothetical protein
VIESACDGATEAVVAEILDWPALWDAGLGLLEKLPSRVRAAIVNDHNFVVNLVQAQLDM